MQEASLRNRARESPNFGTKLRRKYCNLRKYLDVSIVDCQFSTPLSKFLFTDLWWNENARRRSRGENKIRNLLFTQQKDFIQFEP